MDGIVIINKEKKYTSNDVVRKVKKILGVKKVGHTGTLDPNATGVLPLLIGEGTKISKYLINHDKEYVAVLQLGVKTTTADIEGDIIETKNVKSSILSNENVSSVLNSFLGKQQQIPPMYSAIKVNGKKLYDYARNGKTIAVEPRNIEIYEMRLCNIDSKTKQIKFYVKCSKGTYIRSLCENIAEQLNTVGYMLELNRISVGTFNIKESVSIDELEINIKNGDFKNLIQIEDVFKDSECINLKTMYLKQYLNGVSINTINFENSNNINNSNNKNDTQESAGENSVFQDGIYKIYNDGKFIGLGIIYNNKLKRELVLNNPDSDKFSFLL